MEQEIPMNERETATMTITEIPALGYGTTEANISLEKKRASGELSPEVEKKAAEIILSGECIVPVDDTDDGCIDGRPTEEVLFPSIDGSLVRKETDNSNHERAKVAGGGYITGLAMLRSSDTRGNTIDGDLKIVASRLTENKIYCGLHTGEHAHDENVDCGANDRVQTIFENGILYRNEMAGTMSALLDVAGIGFEQEVFDKVISNWSATLNDQTYFEGSTGESRFKNITESIVDAQLISGSEKPVAVSKHLSGRHNEQFILPEYEDGKTFSQKKFDKKLSESFPELEASQRPQAFVVSVWRIVEIAQAMATDENGQQDPDTFKEALYGGVLYQLATAATLTDGSLRNMISQAA